MSHGNRPPRALQSGAGLSAGGDPSRLEAAEPDRIRLYYPKFDTYAQHGEYDAVLELKLLLLMAHRVILPPSHLLRNPHAHTELADDPQFLELLDAGGIWTSVHEDQRDTEDFLAERNIDSRKLAVFLRRFPFEHRVTYVQSRLFRRTFGAGLMGSEPLQRRLSSQGTSARLVTSLADNLYQMGQGEKVALTRDNLFDWYDRNAEPGTRPLLRRYTDYCYYYAGALGNRAAVVPSPFFQEPALMPRLGFYGVNPAYDPGGFRLFFNELGIEDDTIRALHSADVRHIRESPAHDHFIWLYYRLAHEAASRPEAVWDLLMDHHRARDLTFKTVLGREVLGLAALPAIGSAAAAVLVGAPALALCIVVLGGLCSYYVSTWKEPSRPRTAQMIVDVLHGARWPMSVLLERLVRVQTRRHLWRL